MRGPPSFILPPVNLYAPHRPSPPSSPYQAKGEARAQVEAAEAKAKEAAEQVTPGELPGSFRVVDAQAKAKEAAEQVLVGVQLAGSWLVVAG